MHQKTLATLILAAIAFTVGEAGLASERGQSIMFDDNPGIQTSPPITTLHETDDHCQRLAEQVEKLKGKPQRRYAAQRRFNAECRPGHSDD